ncbi:MAG: hypothetical protein KGJ64_05825 [Betaproteobacteria bacterium]|nr:hypothetical protein [Betaproteobacteria bacterium]
MAAIGAAAAVLSAGPAVAAAAPPGGLASSPYKTAAALAGGPAPQTHATGFQLPGAGSPAELALNDLQAMIILALLAGHHRHGAPDATGAIVAMLALQAYAGVQAMGAAPAAAGAGIHVQA